MFAPGTTLSASAYQQACACPATTRVVPTGGSRASKERYITRPMVAHKEGARIYVNPNDPEVRVPDRSCQRLWWKGSKSSRMSCRAQTQYVPGRPLDSAFPMGQSSNAADTRVAYTSPGSSVVPPDQWDNYPIEINSLERAWSTFRASQRTLGRPDAALAQRGSMALGLSCACACARATPAGLDKKVPEPYDVCVIPLDAETKFPSAVTRLTRHVLMDNPRGSWRATSRSGP